MARDIAYVENAVRNARASGTGVTLLVGAGCSVKAGIPLASGFVDKIQELYPPHYGSAREKTYAGCMRELEPGRRRDLIAGYVRDAKINWAHVCIAALMKEGYVDRVLTTNFDNLVVRACALLGEFPAVYDLAALHTFKPADIPGKAVFHLHGQHTGFFLLNTPEEMEKQFEFLSPVFEDNRRRRTWLVVGYSGSDPVFKHLAAVPRFDYGLYWVGYENEEPAEHVREQLLRSDKYAFHVSGYDADDFFVTLSQRLGIFPPGFITDPFTYVEEILETLAPYTPPGEDTEGDVTLIARDRIRRGREVTTAPASSSADTQVTAGSGETPLDTQILTAFMAGNYDRVLALAAPARDQMSVDTEDLLARAYVSSGYALARQARAAPEEADRLFAEAVKRYREAVRIRRDMHEAWYGWGNALANWARQKEGEEADRLFAEAAERYEEAVRIKPDVHGALYQWGKALADRARRKKGAEADPLFHEAVEKFREVVQIKPDKHGAFYRWGRVLADRARRKKGEEADPLFHEAVEKFQEALRIEPDKHGVLNHWGKTLLSWAQRKEGAESDRLLSQAEELLRAVEAIKPGNGAYSLGRLFALKGDEKKTREWLERSREFGKLPDRNHLQNDPDLESIRQAAWFQDLLRNAPAPKNANQPTDEEHEPASDTHDEP